MIGALAAAINQLNRSAFSGLTKQIDSAQRSYVMAGDMLKLSADISAKMSAQEIALRNAGKVSKVFAWI